ncbi:MAG: N-acetylmuramoyl-L-alanine amidase [Chloroflexi bacterium]|nr:N-acetylmuramoyl-L-alanine amidase [Chloroflexota bacterium]
MPLYLGLVLFGFAVGIWVGRSSQEPLTAPVAASVPATPSATATATATATPVATATPIPIPDVAIVAGHYSKDQPGNVATIHDTGSVCPDGLKEVDINLSVAQKTLALLGQMGYRTTLFEEFDSRFKDPAVGRVPDFRSKAFLSIHSDACVTGPEYPLATGWKGAHAEPSSAPEEDDRLVRCIEQSYGAVVKPYNLTFNQNTITPDMTEYHAFRSIVPTTPAAIIELGFMGLDRTILTKHQDELAQGLANGLRAFLQDQSCASQ